MLGCTISSSYDLMVLIMEEVVNGNNDKDSYLLLVNGALNITL